MEERASSSRPANNEQLHNHGPSNAAAGVRTRRSGRGIFKDTSKLLPPNPQNSESSVTQVFKETDKILQRGIQREYALNEKDKELKDANEIIANLRKNIIELQMEYEQLDQNYQREISYRSEISTRMEATKNMVESAVESADVLDTSLKQVEDDKLKLAEFYNMIHENQNELDEKTKRVEKLIQERDEEIEKILARMETRAKDMAQATECNNQLDRKIKSETEKNRQLSAKLAETNSQAENLKSSLDKTIQENQLLKLNSTKYTKEVAGLKKFIEEYKIKEILYEEESRKIPGLESEKEELNNMLRQVQTLYSEFLEENNKLKDEKNQLTTEKENLKQDLEKYKNDFELLQQNSMIEKNDFELHIRNLEEAIAENENVQANLHRKIESLTEGIEKVKSNSEDLEKKLTDKSVEYEGLKKCLEENLREKQHLQLQTDSKDLKQNDKIINLENQVKSLRSKEEDLLKELSGKDTELSELRIEREKISKNVKEISKKSDTYKYAKETAEEELNKLKSTVVAQKSELQNIIIKLQMFEAEKEEMTENLRKSNEKEAKLKEDLSKMSQVMEKHKKQMDLDLDKFKSENKNMESLKKKNEENVIQIKFYDSMVNQLKASLREMTQNNDDISKELKDIKAKESALKSQVEVLQKDLAIRSHERDERDEEIKRIKSDFEQNKLRLEAELKKARSTPVKIKDVPSYGKIATQGAFETKTGTGSQGSPLIIGHSSTPTTTPRTPIRKTVVNSQKRFEPLPQNLKWKSAAKSGCGSASSSTAVTENAATKKKGIYDFESDSSVEQNDPDFDIKQFRQSYKGRSEAKKRK